MDTYGQTTLTAQPIREAKIVFVGEGGSGKTSLMQLLLKGKKEQTARTEKIEIYEDTEGFTYGEKQEKLTLRFWDFGGQDIMHATHKFFMSKRSLYVLISDGRKNEDEALAHWVEMLQSSVGDSPVLLVVNWLDEANDKARIPHLELQRQFPNLILPVIETSWKTERGIQELRNAIQATLQTLPHFQEAFSPLYQSAKIKLESIQKPYIDYQEYERVCKEVAQELESEFNDDSQKLLADILNYLGIMLNFREANDRLEDLYIFQPAWIVAGVYKIINAGESQAQKGKIKKETVTALLREINYTDSRERNFIIDMMKHFKLAFEYPQSNPQYYLIPSLFDKNRPDSIAQNWQKEKVLSVHFKYKIWRNDYISYFLVNEHRQIQAADYWKNGAILDYGEQTAFVEAVPQEKSIKIEVAGANKRYAFWQIKRALTDVHEMFDVEKLGISMWVVYEEDGKKDEFSYTRLRKMLDGGRQYEYSEVFDKDIDIAQLLGEVSLTQEESKEAIRQAMLNLVRANITGYFEELDKLELPKDLQSQCNHLRKEFINGDHNAYTGDRLEIFAQEVANRLERSKK